MKKLNPVHLSRKFLSLLNFVVLISLYVLFHSYAKLHKKFRRNQFARTPFQGIYNAVIGKLDKEREGSISRLGLIELSIRNMADKKTRTWITMGGMAIGIGLIVLLVSIGYGLENLVVSRVARLEELKQADVVPGLSDNLLLTDKSISEFQQIAGVTEVIPVISAVGKINYNNSHADMAVYGVTSSYLKESAVIPSSGEIFESDDLKVDVSKPQDKKKSVSLKDIDGDHEVTFDLEQGSWYRVRQSADPESSLIGYTRYVKASQKGVEITGTTYTWDGKTDKKWLQATVPLWEKRSCEGEESCEDGEYIPLMSNGAQVTSQGYLAEIALKVAYLQPKAQEHSEPVVLGETTDGSLPVVEIASLSARTKDSDVKTVAVGGKSDKELVINRSALKVLGLEEKDAVGTNLKITFVIVGTGIDSAKSKTESLETEYKIVGVIPDENTPLIYVPFVDLRSLGVESYSQIKIITENKDTLQKVRTSIESSGYGTISVVDTIGQIDKLFTSIRAFLATLGIVALSVAALGMFNTLTVSLLERTHEVGLMKAIGMKSSEVKELFMTESMIMGFFGGILGLFLGIFAGFVLSLVLSLFSITKGAGFLNISYVPWTFALLIVIVSLLVGVGTGYIPARRATRISALDALRYE